MRRCAGFTLMEILIAAGILSMFMTGVFQLYRSGSQSFMLGSWKTRTQKEAQLFLEELRSVVEISGNALVFRDAVIDPPLQLPIRLNSGANNTSLLLGGLVGSQIIGYMNLVTPCTLYSSLAPARSAGTWVGVVLTAEKEVLRLQTYIDPSLMPPQAMIWALPLGGDFIAAPAASLRAPRILRDVEQIEMQSQFVDGRNQLLIKLTLRRPNSQTRVIQEIRANLLKGVGLEWF